MSSKSLHLCFCNLCEGKAHQSGYKVKQHAKLYGTLPTAKKSRVEESDSSASDSSDSEKCEKKEHVVEEGSSIFPLDGDWDDDVDDVRDDDDKVKIDIEQFLEGVDPIPAVVENADYGTDSSDFDTEEGSSESESEDAGDGVISDIHDINEASFSQETHDLREAVANSPLLHSSLTCTLFETLVHLFDWFSSHPSISKEAFSKNLQIWHSILPEGNLLPTCYRDAYKIIKPYLDPEIIFHVCPNDCILFRGEYKQSVVCPKCNESRFKAGKIPRRTFHYLPLSPRLARSFGTKDISYLLQSHEGGKQTSSTGGIMNDIHDSPRWKEAFSPNGTFEGDPRGTALSLCLDGLNPWSKNKTNYSMWPIVLGQLNLPRNVRYHLANLLLVGIIPSQVQGAEPKNLDPYLEVLIDEIIYLGGCKLYDAYRKAPFNVKVEILIYVLDYQGFGKVFSLTGTGSYRACAWCMFQGQYCKHLSKMVYAGNRRFLPIEHELRKDQHNFPQHSAELRGRPVYRKFQQDLSFHKAYDNAKNKTQSSRVASGTGCRGVYMLAQKCPGFDRVQQTMPDAMHTVAVQVKHLHRCLAGKASEDSLAVRKQEMELNRFPECWPRSTCSPGDTGPSSSKCSKRGKNKKEVKKNERGEKESFSLPTAPFGLTKQQLEEADRRARQVIVPTGDSFSPGPIFSRISRLNSHEWKEVAVRGVLKYCIRGMLGDEQSKTIILFTDAIAALCAPSQDAAKIEHLKEQVNVALARLERDFPLSLQVVTNHILHHLPEGIQKFGPVHGTWMFAYERFNSWLCRRAMNRKHPEATILRTYQIFEWCHYAKVCGAMEHKLPFQLPPEAENFFDDHIPSQGNSQGLSFDLSIGDLKEMEKIYQNVVSEYQSLLTLYAMEKERARKQGKLKMFPKAFSQWRPEGSMYSESQLNAICAAPQSKATVYEQYSLETKQHSHSYLYISKEHHNKRPSCVYCSLPCSGASQASQEMNFGVIQRLYQHSFAEKSFMWAAVSLYMEPCYDASCGLWRAENKTEKRILVLLRSISRPLTVAHDSNIIWFLDVYP